MFDTLQHRFTLKENSGVKWIWDMFNMITSLNVELDQSIDEHRATGVAL